jgi:hypothetical protein
MLLFFHKIKSRKIHDEAVLHTLHLEFSSIKNRQAFGSQLQIETIVFLHATHGSISITEISENRWHKPEFSSFSVPTAKKTTRRCREILATVAMGIA